MMDETSNDGDIPHSLPQERNRVLKLVGIVVAVVMAASIGAFLVLPSLDAVGPSRSAGHHRAFDPTTATDPFRLDPVHDLGMVSVDRALTDASPSRIWNGRKGPLPTNSWYLVRRTEQTQGPCFTLSLFLLFHL
jgi:hypothetical protein